MKIGAILFFRMNSKRLPGKSLMKLGEETLLEIIYRKSLLIKGINDIVVATSSNYCDDEIADKCNELKIKVYRGSLDDVAKRGLNCALNYEMDYFMRVCGDRPFMDAKLASEQVNFCYNMQYDLITNCFPKTYPSGMDSEIISTKTLENNIQFFNGKEHNEHLTSYFYANYKNFKILNLESSEAHSFVNENLSIDTMEDYKKMTFLKNYLEINKIKNSSIAKKIEILNKYKN